MAFGRLSNLVAQAILVLGAVLVAAVVTVAIGDLFQSRLSLIPFLLAVTAVAVLGGFRPGAIATATAALAASAMLQPLALPDITTRGAETALALFVLEGLAISGLGEVVRRSRASAETAAARQTALLEAERVARSAAERATSRAEGLQATASALGHALAVDEVAQIAVEQGLARLGAGRGVVGILEPNGHTIRTKSAIGFRDGVLEDWPTYEVSDEVPISDAIRRREPIILEESEQIRATYPRIAATTADGGPAVIVPMLYEDRAVGALYFRYVAEASIGAADVPYLETLGRLCGAALERARLHEAESSAWAQVEEAQDRIAFLAQVGEVLGQAADVESALTQITRYAIPGVADAAAAFVHQPDGSISNIALAHREPARESEVRRYLTGRPPKLTDSVGAGRAIATGEVQLVPDYFEFANDPIVPADARKLVRDAGIRSVMHCPLIGDTFTFGSLALATTGDRRYGEADRDFGSELGRRVGQALEKVRLNTRLRDRLRREEAVARIGQLALEQRDLDAFFEQSSRELALVIGADVVAIQEALQDEPVLIITAGYGWREGIVGRTRIPSNKRSQAGFALALDGSVVSADYEKERRFRPSPLILEHGARSGVTTPIRGPDGAWGALGVYSRTPGRFDADEVAFLEAVANVIGSAIGRRAVEDRIEELVEAERRAAELGQAFIGVVSHELRTPITSIYAGAKLLHRMRDGGNEATRAELTSDIEAEADRLYRLTEDLLVLTRVERGTLEIGAEPVALNRVMERVVASERERWPATTIELDLPSETPIVLGDNTYVEQLVRNLVGNAAKYSPAGSTVSVAVASTATEVEIRILDNGPGLAEEDEGRLFRLFYRSPRTAKKAPGAGIGLFVCDQLARAMGGRIWARNRDDGQGSEFGFSLRQYTPEAESHLGPLLATTAAVAERSDEAATPA